MDSWSNSRSPFLCNFPKFSGLGIMKKEFGSYIAGFLFAIGWWVFVDGIILSTTFEELPVYIGFEDYISGIISTLGMIIVSSIDQSLLEDDSMTFGGSGVVGKARVMLFIGMAAMGGGIAGSVVGFIDCTFQTQLNI
ncbi:Vacuolar protein sorting-associated protein 68, variant 2 [Basidiobolus ranarum]|uniref:Vacuolar protein sorting-associated protein 68, variant 2 n=1 Tax=Basidiobolus ranarum TaxID=34480 RepID=A0ABR2WRP4_9FUNG